MSLGAPAGGTMIQRLIPTSSSRRASAAVAAVLLIAGALVSFAGCTDNRSRPRPVQPERVARDMPSILRGVIGAESRVVGAEPVFVSGYGIVVGLKGTGAADVHPGIRATLEREMARRGVGKETSGMGWTTPSRMIEDPNTAVVLVQAALPVGASEGARFDVFVRALPGSSTTSLEGGRLWSTDLRLGVQMPGGPDVQPLAEAAGDVFINPFADPAKQGEDSINRTSGRILNGGVVKTDQRIVLALDNPSHARARSIVATINARFPQGKGDRKPTAWGINEELVQLHIPAAWQERPDEFLNVLLATRVDMAFPQEYARRYAQALRDQPEYATELSFRLQALGEAALPDLRKFYDFGEMAPRLAALRAGARLSDAMVADPLRDIATGGPPAARAEAIDLLADLPPDPKVNLVLRGLLDAEQIEVRVAAYEALARRADPSIRRRAVNERFSLDSMPAKRPMIYVSQQGVPRIVLFGAAISVKRPSLVSAWSDRLMVTADSPTDDLRVYYRDYKSGKSATYPARALLDEFIRFLAHETSPEDPQPGLNLSYSEVVGALHELWKHGGIEADFVAEQDKLAAQILRATERQDLEERPETDAPAPDAETEADVEAPKPALGAKAPEPPPPAGARPETGAPAPPRRK